MVGVTALLLILALGSSVALPAKSPKARAAGCGYQSCAPVYQDKLNIHLVPHTHDDVGWLKTVDQYFYGSRNSIQLAGVQYIIDSVVQSLSQNPDRKFIYVETAFFWQWWVEQTEEMQTLVKTLVNEGRLEFIGGAWSMNDEAASHYYSIIDQFTWGLRKLNDTFGACGRPHIGWQIDPFGHSREMASIFAQMGYDGLLFARLDYQDHNKRLSTKTSELIWQGSSNLGPAADLFTSILYAHYGPPPGFCFDITCNDAPFIDNKKSPDYNVDQRVHDFLEYVRNQASKFTSNNIILTMGSDFQYQEADMWYKNLDKLIKYVNAADETVNVIYSTPSCYLKAVNDAGLTYTTKFDDFFPYANDANSYWTGYFTSRPTSKYYERLGNNFLQVVKQLAAVTQLGQIGDSPLDSLRETMGVLQHHDSITGTEKQHVADDYARMLTSSIEEARGIAETAINALISDGTNPIKVQNCLKLNVSACAVTEAEEQFVITAYNPLSHSVNHTVRIPVTDGTFTVLDPEGQELTVQLLPIHDAVLNDPERDDSMATHDLVFRALNLPPLGFKSYYVRKTSSTMEPIEPVTDDTIGGENLKVTLDTTTGFVKSITINGEEIALSQKFYYYQGFNDNNSGSTHRSSGAYVFRPIQQTPNEVLSVARYSVFKGDLVDEIHQTLTTWVNQVVRINKEDNYVEFDWIVGPIPIEDQFGKEVISRFTTDLQTEGVFYTDSNGRELLQRKRDFRPTWELDPHEPVAGNYYPITSKILIRDIAQAKELAVLTDRAQGGSSMNDGEVELMVHRRLLHDDAFGVGEALNEQAYGKGLIAKGKHYVMAGSTSSDSPSLAAQEREVAQQKILSPWLFFTPTQLTFENWQNTYKMEFSGLTQELPPNVVIHTLEPWREDTLLLRLEHILEIAEDSELSQPVAVDFQDIFSTFAVTSTRETTLAGNQWFEEMDRLVWKAEESSDLRVQALRQDSTLAPMQIGTYVINVAKK